MHSSQHVCYAFSWGLPTVLIIMQIINNKEQLSSRLARSGSNVCYCKECMEEASLRQRNCLQAQLYMLTFTRMNKSRLQFYYPIPVRHHLQPSKECNVTETSDHPRGCATEAKRTHENITEEKYCSKTLTQRLFFSQGREVIIWTTISGAGKVCAGPLQLQKIT